MSGRYLGRLIAKNDSKQYLASFKKRSVNFIVQYSTPDLTFPSEEDEAELDFISHLWQVGDRYYKLAHKYYGDGELWWIIAFFNKKPTESHLKVGDVIDIPIPSDKIKEFFGV